MGFGADLATGTEDNVTNLRSSIVAHGTTDKPGGRHPLRPAGPDRLRARRDPRARGRGARERPRDRQVAHGDGEDPAEDRRRPATRRRRPPRRQPTPAAASPARPSSGGPPRLRPSCPTSSPTDFVNFRTCNPSSFGTCVPPERLQRRVHGHRQLTQPDLQYGVRNISAVGRHDAVRRRPEEDRDGTATTR